MQDWLSLGEGSRMNTPGTDRGNWQWRLLPGEAGEDLAARIREMVGNEEVVGKETGEYRKIQYRDIVILLRAVSAFSLYSVHIDFLHDIFYNGLQAADPLDFCLDSTTVIEFMMLVSCTARSLPWKRI